MTYTTGSYSNVGEYCSIWYSKYYTNKANYLYSFTATTFSPTATDSRAYGCSVRPV